MTDPSKKYDVAVLGWWYGKNYGSILTYYGLNRAITSLGRSALMVHEPLGYNGFRVSWPDDILSMEFARRIGYDYTQQEHYSQLPRLNDVARTFVVGSDQLWNPMIGRVNDDLFLDFVDPSNDRVAYATSFGNRGTDKFKAPFITKHAANLQKFKAISVRENYAIDTARDVFGAKATLVVDPVFLMSQEHYAELADTATVTPEGGHMAVFFLDPNPEKKAVALAIATKLGFEKILVIPNPDEGREAATSLFQGDSRVEVLAEDAPENFLRAYRDAGYVVTDSFHGTAFAAIFEKPFSSIYNTKRGADRFKNLLASLGFDDSRRVFETDGADKIAANENVSREIDFTKAREYIEKGRASSMEWLKTALDPDKKDSAAVRPYQHFALRNPEFEASSDAWKVTRKSGAVRLRVARGGAVRGNLVWTELPQPLTKGSAYRLSIDWTPQSEASTVNLHLRNPATGTFRVIGSVDLSKGSGRSRQDSVLFSVQDAGYTQVALGAVHFPGRRGGADVRSIDIDEVPASAMSAAARQTKGGAKDAPGARQKELAIPGKTRDREEMILSVLNDPHVNALKHRIVSVNPDIPIYMGRELKEYTWNKVGGPADILAFPRTIDELKQLVDLALEDDVPYTILGRGTNVIVRDGGIRGIVIITTGLNYFKLEDGIFTAGAGASFIEASYFLLEHGLSTLEWASGIPGTVGGAVYMNAGTNVSDVRATIRSVTYLDHKGNIRELQKDQISWGKRYTTFQDHPNWVVLEATFTTSPSDKEDLSKKMLRTVQVRENHFPLESPNHGSTFKWWRAPRLIMQSGLTGYRIGGAQISTKQPGFFVNVDRATAADYEALVDYAIGKVYEHSGFLLEPEVEFLGERPHRYERYTTGSPVTDLERKATGPQA
ncbi:UDP-N-acetylmuramate dehydrogenase [Demequina sp. NBRC 110053]|uniref:UDP-N-acetylmuramate dehydrogenase n=1 Tax=Demequina sp. NBRC 110053 TaxID=1570342 RepID=UPI001185DD52|nr:UDP-N-acetylmuramate dehydrogenase [Demequina sp. NBRC 110053]